MRGTLLAAIIVALTAPVPASGATYYLGAFTGSTPLDDADCGTGMGAHPSPHPCATLAYWTANRRLILVPGDVVRLTGTLNSCGSVACSNLCIVPQANVTYEGRTAADGPVNAAGCGAFGCTFTSATIDGTAQISGGTCLNRIVSGSGNVDLTNFVLRDLHFIVATGHRGIAIRGDTGGVVSSNVTVVRNKIEGPSDGEGMIAGSVEATDPPCRSGRNLINSTISDNEFTASGGNNGGLWIGCASNLTVQRNSVHDVTNDGMHLGGLTNSTLSDNYLRNIGQDGIDVSGNNTPPMTEGACHDDILERNVVENNAFSGMSLNHGAYNITLRDNFIFGSGIAILLKRCPHDLKLYNNTMWTVTGGRGISIVSMVTNVDIENNLVRSLETTNMPSAISWIPAAFNPSNIVAHNNLIEPSGGNVFTFNGDTAGCSQDPTVGIVCGTANADCGGSGYACTARRPCSWCRGGTNHRSLCCIAGSGCDPGWLTSCGGGGVCTGVDPSYSTNTTYNVYSTYQADVNGTTKLTPTGANDIWHTVPIVVDASTPSVVNLHLAPNDTIDRDHGTTLSPSFLDYDGTTRPQGVAWDIGAHEVVTSGPLAPALVSVDVVP